MENQENTPTPRMGINRPKRLNDLQSEERMKEIQEKRRAIQEKLQREKPEKERQAALERKAYNDFSPYVTLHHIRLFCQIKNHVPFDDYHIDLNAAQAYLKRNGQEPLLVCNMTASEIRLAFKEGKLPLLKGPFKLVGLARGAIITKDGYYFEIKISHSKQTLKFIQYTDDFLS